MPVPSLVRFAVLTAFACLGVQSPATAATTESLVGCSNVALGTATAPGGAFFVLGQTRLCADGSPDRSVAVRLAGDGSVDESWSDGGVHALTPVGAGVTGFEASGGRLVHSGRTAITRLGPDGEPDPTFGAGGTVPDVNSVLDGHSILEMEVDSQGRIVVLADTHGVILARYDPDGSIDESFGAGGTARPGLPPSAFESPAYLEVDGDDRIVVAGRDVYRAGILRLLEDGGADTGFGGSGNGYAETDEVNGFSLSGLGIGPQDEILARFTGFHDTYSVLSVQAGLDASGIPSPSLTRDLDFEMSSYALLGSLDSFVAAGFGGGRQPGSSHFGMRRDGGQGWSRSYWFSPGESYAQSIEYLSDRGQLLAAGESRGFDCSSPRCPSRRFMAIAKVDSQSGDAVEDFGVDGKVLIPENRCLYGEAPQPSIRTWQRCRVHAPRIAGKARLRKPRKGPFVASVALDHPPAGPSLTQRVTFTLPKSLRLKHGLNPRNTRAWMEIDTSVPRRVTRAIKGRRVSLSLDLRRGDADATGPVFHFRVARGAIRGWKRTRNPAARKLHVAATNEISRAGLADYAPGSSRASVIVRKR
jgi:uncharacterized delta-60 repeat protein